MNPFLRATAVLTAVAVSPLFGSDHIRAATSFEPLEFPPQGLFSADLNADGLGDLVVLGANPLRYQILLATPGGGWDRQTPVELDGTSVSRARTADINGDGRQDLLILASSAPVLHILLNTGNGSLTPSASSPLPVVPNAQTFAVGDLNGDGLADIVIGRSQQLLVFENAGSDAFMLPGDPVVVSQGTQNDIVIGDFRLPGLKEIAVLSGTNIYFMHRTGSTFVQGATAQNPLGGIRAIAADATGDGIINVVTLSGSRVGVTVTTFVPSTQQYAVISPQGTLPSHSAVEAAFGDLSGNGRIDVVPGTTGSTPARVLYNEPSGLPYVRETGLPLGDFHDLRYPTILDVDGDGRNDIAYATQAASGFVVFRQSEAGGFSSASLSQATGTFQANSLIRLPDVDGRAVFFEGASSSTRPARKFSAIPDGTGFALDVTTLTDIDAGSSNPANWVTGDLNGDGIPDIAHAGSGAQFVWQLGRADGTYFPALGRPSPGLTSETAGLTVGDLNNDGFDDLAALVNNGRIIITFGQADGFLSPAVEFQMITQTNPRGLLAADIDADGNIDLVCLNRSASTIAIAYGRGDGTFEPTVFVPTTNTPGGTGNAFGTYSDAGDLNGDGYLDILVASVATSVVHVSNGPRSFEPLMPVSTGSSVTHAQFVDFDADGLLDIATTSRYFTEIVTRTGRGLIEQRDRLLDNESLNLVEFADMDGDGRPDMIFSRGGIVTVIFNQSDELCLGDHYADGRLDLFDVAQFLRNYTERNPIADPNRDGFFNFLDIAVFLEAFNNGCP